MAWAWLGLEGICVSWSGSLDGSLNGSLNGSLDL